MDVAKVTERKRKEKEECIVQLVNLKRKRLTSSRTQRITKQVPTQAAAELAKVRTIMCYYTQNNVNVSTHLTPHCTHTSAIIAPCYIFNRTCSKDKLREGKSLHLPKEHW